MKLPREESDTKGETDNTMQRFQNGTIEVSKSFIDSQKEWAKGAAVYAHPDTRDMVESAIQAIVATIITNTGEELMRSMPEEGIKWMQEGSDKKRKGYTEGFNEALDTLKKHITSVTGVENV